MQGLHVFFGVFWVHGSRLVQHVGMTAQNIHHPSSDFDVSYPLVMADIAIENADL